MRRSEHRQIAIYRRRFGRLSSRPAWLFARSTFRRIADIITRWYIANAIEQARTIEARPTISLKRSKYSPGCMIETTAPTTMLMIIMMMNATASQHAVAWRALWDPRISNTFWFNFKHRTHKHSSTKHANHHILHTYISQNEWKWADESILYKGLYTFNVLMDHFMTDLYLQFNLIKL